MSSWAERLEAADDRWRKGDLDGAAALLREIAASGDDTVVPVASHSLGRLLEERGDLDAVGDPAERCKAEKLLGAALFDLGEPAEAREAYRRAAEDHRPEIRLDALIQQSKFTRELGDEEEARAILWRVVESGHPRFALEARACLGQVYSEEGEVDDALACWQVVLGTDSEFHRGAVHFLGMMLHGLPGNDPRRAEVIALLERATELDDADVVFQARMTLAQAEVAVRGPDEEVEQAIDDCDTALERLRAGDLAEARALLRRVIDAEIAGQSERASSMLAVLELGAGDPEQAEELLEYIADGPDITTGFAAAVNRHLIVSGGGTDGAPHPVLAAEVDYQRFGREAGVARYQECAGHTDPAVAALAKSMLAKVYVSLGVPRSQGLELLDEAAAAGDPLALSHAAVLSWLFHGGDGVDEVIGLLRRAREHGDPALAPWVAQALGATLQGRDQGDDADEALAAYEAVSSSGHPGLGVDAESKMLEILEGREDLAGAAAVHERIVARGDRLQAPRSAWMLGLTRVRLDDFDAACAAYAQVPEDHPELGGHGVFARRLLDRDFEGATAALAAVRKHDELDDLRMYMTTWLTMEAAHAWQRAGETTAADAALSLVITDGHPERVQEAALFLGLLRNDEGDHAGAADAWTRAAAGDDEHQARKAVMWLGDARCRLADLHGAATAYRQALDTTNPDDDEYPQLLDSVIRALVGAGRTAEARALLMEKIGEGPHAGLMLGGVLEEHDALDAATAHYQEVIDAVAIDDANADGVAPDAEIVPIASACVRLARLLARRGDAPQAVEAARRGILLFDRLAAAGDEVAAESVAVAAYELGGYLTETGDTEGAREAYERATASADLDVRLPAKERLGTASLNERAVLRLREGDRAAALELFIQGYGVPELAELHIALFEEQFATMRSLLERSADTEHAEQASGMVTTAALEMLDAGTDDARKLSDLVLEFGTSEQVAGVCDDFGHAYDLAGDTDAAVEVLKRGAAVDHPFALPCLRRLIGLLALQGDHAALEAAARRAVDSGDPATVAHGSCALGNLAKDRGDLAEAAARYRTAIEGHASEAVPYIQLELGKVLWELGDSDAAHRAMEAVLACDDPGQVLLAGHHLGAWLAEDGRLAGAAEAFGAAAAAGHRHPDPGEHDHEAFQMALNSLAAVAYQADEAGQHAVAVRALHLAAAGGAHGDAVQIAKEYATTAAERGDLDAVRMYYKGAAAFPPDGAPSLLMELAGLLAEHGATAEARALLEPLVASGDPHVRLAATAQLLPMLKEAGEDDRAIEVAAHASGKPVPRPAAEATEKPEVKEPEHADAAAADIDDAEHVGDMDDAGSAAETDDTNTEADERLTDEEIERRRAELFALVDEYDGPEEPRLVDPLRMYLRDEAGTPRSSEAGQRVIRTARQVMSYDTAQACEIFQLVVEYGDPAEVAVAYDEIGDILGYHEDDMNGAIAAYRKGARVDDPAALLPLRSLLIALIEVEDYDGVSEHAQRAVTSGDPHTVAIGYLTWGDVRRRRGDTDAAVRLYRQGIDAGFEDLVPSMRIELARTLRDRGENEQARAELRHATAAADPDARARAGTLLGMWAFEDDDLEAAAEAFGRVAAIGVDTGDADPLDDLIEAAATNVIVVANRAHAEGEHPVAVRALTLAAQAGHVRDALEMSKARAIECAEAGDRAAAMLYVKGAVGFISGSDPDVEIELADLFAAAGDLAEARVRYERLIDHSDAEVRLVAAGRLVPLLRQTGDTEGLEDITQRMTDDSAETGLEGAQALLGSMLGLMQSEQGDDEGALRTFRAAAESGEPTALFTLGNALVDAGELDEAREVLTRIPETETGIGRRALVALGQTYHDEDGDQARELYLRALETPGEPDGIAATLARMYLGSLAKQDRDWPAALRWYQQVIDSGGMTANVSQTPLAAAHLGELAYWLGDRDSAVRFYELTLATGTEQADLVGEAAYRLGEIRHGDGDLELARTHLRRAIESGDEEFAEQARTLLVTFDALGTFDEET